MNWYRDLQEQGSLILETAQLARAYHDGGPKALADCLEEIVATGTLHAQAASFVADVLRGNVTRPRARPRKEVDNKAGARVIELERQGMNRKSAVAQVAKEWKRTPRTVEKSLARYNACAEEFLKTSGIDIRK
jgi:hypothetical protein